MRKIYASPLKKIVLSDRRIEDESKVIDLACEILKKRQVLMENSQVSARRSDRSGQNRHDKLKNTAKEAFKQN